MIEVRPVEDLEIPELAPYRNMRGQREQRDQQIFVAEGEKVVRRLLESDLEVVSLLLPQKWLQIYADLLAKRPEPIIPVFTADKSLLETLTGFSMYQGVLAVARVPERVRLGMIIAQASRPLLILAVEGLSSAENLGGLIRNSVAFGASAMLVGESCCSPYLRRSVRSSMGTIFKQPMIESQSLVEDLRLARNGGIRTVAAHPHADKRTLWSVDFRRDTIIVLGNEGAGLSTGVLELCDEAVAIPMQNGVDSLNVGAAGAVFLAEAMRQRE